MTDHIVINVETGQYECQHCGATQSPPKMPVPINDMLAHIDMFTAAHRNCVKASAQPAQKPLTDDLLGLLKEARKIIRASSSRNLVKDWDGRATQAIEQALKVKNNGA
jgi:hypothetical protein